MKNFGEPKKHPYCKNLSQWIDQLIKANNENPGEEQLEELVSNVQDIEDSLNGKKPSSLGEVETPREAIIDTAPWPNFKASPISSFDIPKVSTQTSPKSISLKLPNQKQELQVYAFDSPRFTADFDQKKYAIGFKKIKKEKLKDISELTQSIFCSQECKLNPSTQVGDLIYEMALINKKSNNSNQKALCTAQKYLLACPNQENQTKLKNLLNSHKLNCN